MPHPEPADDSVLYYLYDDQENIVGQVTWGDYRSWLKNVAGISPEMFDE